MVAAGFAIIWDSCIESIIRYALGDPGLKRALVLLLLSASLVSLNCGNYTPPSGSPGGKIAFRAFVSQDVSAGNVLAGLIVVDAQRDVESIASPISAGVTPGMMVVTPNRNQTLVFSPADNLLSLINNASDANAAQLTLPGFTESFVVSPDSLTAYAAVPTAKVNGQSPGVVKVVGLSSGKFTAEIDISAVRFLSMSHSGNRILAFSDNSNLVAVITPSNIGTGNPVVVFLGGFDRPVQASFSSDDNTAFVVNCGAECGGTSASVQKLDLTQTQCPPSGVCPPVPVPAATVAVVNGTAMYLAGTPVPASPCTGQQTAATNCGLLTVFDLPSMTVTNSGIVITDGYHNRMALGANGQLFIGARTCTEISPPNPTNEVRGCLSIFNIQTSAVVIPPANGDATGIQPIANRTVVYVVQGGELAIYDTATDKLQKTQIDIAGEAIDVKTIDF
jgi:DNA-binding beta-propeller fold protein YncE